MSRVIKISAQISSAHRECESEVFSETVGDHDQSLDLSDHLDTTRCGPGVRAD